MLRRPIPRHNRGRIHAPSGGSIYYDASMSGGIWLRGDMGVSDTAGSVDAWANQGDAALLASVTQTGSARPTTTTLGGKPALAFASASSQYLQGAATVIAQPFLIVCVCEVASSTDFGLVSSGDSAARVWMRTEGGASFRGEFRAPDQARTANLYYSVSTLQQLAIVYDSAGGSIAYRDGVDHGLNGTLFDPNTNSLTGLTIGAIDDSGIGATNFLNGKIGEVIVMADPGASARAAILAGSKAYWGIA